MFELLVVIGAGIGGYIIARDFVRTRLRFVDAIHHPLAPFIAGIGVALAAWPLALLPVITTGTTAILGLGAGLGTRKGQKLLKSGN